MCPGARFDHGVGLSVRWLDQPQPPPRHASLRRPLTPPLATPPSKSRRLQTSRARAHLDPAEHAPDAIVVAQRRVGVRVADRGAELGLLCLEQRREAVRREHLLVGRPLVERPQQRRDLLCWEKGVVGDDAQKELERVKCAATPSRAQTAAAAAMRRCGLRLRRRKITSAWSVGRAGSSLPARYSVDMTASLYANRIRLEGFGLDMVGRNRLHCAR